MKNQILFKISKQLLNNSKSNNGGQLSSTSYSYCKRYYSDKSKKDNDGLVKNESEDMDKKYEDISKKIRESNAHPKTKSSIPVDYVDPTLDSDYNMKRARRLLSNSFRDGWRKIQDPFNEFRGVGKGLFPSCADIVVIGGGAIGTSIAYFLKQKALNGLSVVVIDKDFTVNYDLEEYARSSTTLSVGGLRQQFSNQENIQMSLFGAEFLRNFKHNCHVIGEDQPDVHFTPHGYLFCASEKGAVQLEVNHNLQIKLGARNVLLSPQKLKEKFPWMKTDGIALACLGLEKEGWFDPWLYLSGMKKKAISLGAEYIKGEVIGFPETMNTGMSVMGYNAGQYKAINHVQVKDEYGDIRLIQFSKCVIAAGAFSGNLAELLSIGDSSKDEGLLFVPLPVEPRKRYVYCFECHKGPGINTPMVIDPSGTYFRREGLGNYYICGRSPPSEDLEPGVDNLDVDYDFFNEHIWPVLANRVKGFEELKVNNAWAGYYDYNYFDENAILGTHPAYHNIYFATGFSGHGIQQAPAVGRAITELMIENKFETIDLSRFLFERIALREPVKEANIV